MSSWKNFFVFDIFDIPKLLLTCLSESLIGTGIDLVVEHEGIKVKTNELETCTGDVDLSNRKGKLITIFDVQLTLKWSGNASDGTEVKGTIHIPEFAHDTEPSDIVFDITVEEENSRTEPIEDLVRKDLVPLLRERLGNFSKDLIDNHSKDVYIKPSEVSTSNPTQLVTPSHSTVESPIKISEKADSGRSLGKKSLNTIKLTETIEFQTSADQIYEAYLNPERVAIWTRAKPELARHVGGAYSLFGGNITGIFTELCASKLNGCYNILLDPESKNRTNLAFEDLISKHFQKCSPPHFLHPRIFMPEHFSNVILTFDQASDFTRVHITQEGVPVGEEEVVRRNWQNYYWNPIKSVFGYAFFTTPYSSSANSSSSTSSSSAEVSRRYSKPSSSSSSQKPRSKEKRNTRRHKHSSYNEGEGGGSGMALGFGITVALVLTAIVLGFIWCTHMKWRSNWNRERVMAGLKNVCKGLPELKTTYRSSQQCDQAHAILLGFIDAFITMDHNTSTID
ncbi:hypothetical protein G9A89_006250 [Geosiphon pyriformis]|nr:hypothetical protein G9A89_006250 [Geosiphon pyriformis]